MHAFSCTRNFLRLFKWVDFPEIPIDDWWQSWTYWVLSHWWGECNCFLFIRSLRGCLCRGLFIIDDKGILRQITMNDLPVRLCGFSCCSWWCVELVRKYEFHKLNCINNRYRETGISVYVGWFLMVESTLTRIKYFTKSVILCVCACESKPGSILITRVHKFSLALISWSSFFF